MPPPDKPKAKFSSALASVHTAATFTAIGSDLFANVDGELSLNTAPVVTDRLWNPCIATWYTGKDNPKVALLRLNAENVAAVALD